MYEVSQLTRKCQFARLGVLRYWSNGFERLTVSDHRNTECLFLAVLALLQRLLGKKTDASDASPIAAYFQQKAEQQGYTLSDGQIRAISALNREAQHLLNVQATRSLYLHGPVGRGKSWLLDGFFQALPIAEKQRVHFHTFFARLHQGMFLHREHDDALGATLDELLTGFVPRRSSRLRTDEPFRTVIAATDAPAAWTVSVSADPPVVTSAPRPIVRPKSVGERKLTARPVVA